jgi:hypothetical protein
MQSNQLKSLISVVCSFLLLISCGSGGGGMTAGGGIGGTGIISQGAVSAFGSIFVNGTEFDTSNAVININGEEGFGDEFLQDNLDIGQVVTVEGKINSDGSVVADRVTYNSNVVGPVSAVSGIDSDTNEITIDVLGQTVVINLITQFKGTTYDTIDVDDVVVVSGYKNFDGSIRATFIEKTGDFSAGSQVEVTGFITNLNTRFETFEIQDLTVNYAVIAGDLPEGIPADNLLVEVRGTLDTPDGVLIATDIELADELVGEEVEEYEIMGFVTEVISENEIIKFKIGNQEVHADADPAIVEYVDGNSGNIALGQKLEAEGSLEGGILIAWEIEFWKPDQIEVEGIVDDVVFNGDFPEFTFEGREDQLFQTNNETEFENVEPDEVDVGMPIEVKGVPVDIDRSVVVADKVSFELE